MISYMQVLADAKSQCRPTQADALEHFLKRKCSDLEANIADHFGQPPWDCSTDKIDEYMKESKRVFGQTSSLAIAMAFMLSQKASLDKTRDISHISTLCKELIDSHKPGDTAGEKIVSFSVEFKIALLALKGYTFTDPQKDLELQELFSLVVVVACQIFTMTPNLDAPETHSQMPSCYEAVDIVLACNDLIAGSTVLKEGWAFRHFLMGFDLATYKSIMQTALAFFEHKPDIGCLCLYVDSGLTSEARLAQKSVRVNALAAVNALRKLAQDSPMASEDYGILGTTVGHAKDYLYEDGAKVIADQSVEYKQAKENFQSIGIEGPEWCTDDCATFDELKESARGQLLHASPQKVKKYVDGVSSCVASIKKAAVAFGLEENSCKLLPDLGSYAEGMQVLYDSALAMQTIIDFATASPLKARRILRNITTGYTVHKWSLLHPLLKEEIEVRIGMTSNASTTA